MHGARGWSYDEQQLSRTDGRPTTGASAAIVRENVECKSPDALLGASGKETLSSCASLCADMPDCKYFVYGNKGTTGAGFCYQEKTASELCTEGWQSDNKYTFYKLTSRGSSHADRTAMGVQPSRRFSSDTRGNAAKPPGPYDVHTLSCSKDDANSGISSGGNIISVVGCSKDNNPKERFLPRPDTYSDSSSATVAVEAFWHRVGYVDASYRARNVTLYIRSSMKPLICGKWEQCVVGSTTVGHEKANRCAAPACPNPLTGASGPLRKACVCEGGEECFRGQMCTTDGTCAAGCPSNGERTSERCLCSHPDLSGGTWCDAGYACDHKSATCALHVCSNGDGSAAVRIKNGCVCTGTKYSEVCLEGEYCMAEALDRWDDDEPLSLCQTKCDAEVSRGSIVSTACAREMEGLRRVTPGRREAPMKEKSLRELRCAEGDEMGWAHCA